MVLIMFASHLWLAKYLMLINSLILSVNSGRKVHVKSCLLPSKGYEFEARICTGSLGHPWAILRTDPPILSCLKPTFGS